MKKKRIGLLGYDEMTALDLVGPMDAFAQVGSPAQPNPYDLVVVGLNDKPFKAHSGLVIKPQETLQTVGRLDTLVIPGGIGSRVPENGRIVSEWVRAQASGIRRLASVCTGIYLVAPSGLLDGREVTTHWVHAQDVARRFPKLKVSPNAIYLKSDKFYTSAGITAGIDLALALIEEDCGADMALKVAREMVVYIKRPGGQMQFSEPLRMQAESLDPFSGLVAWMVGNLSSDLSVDVLAGRMSLSRRQFTRLFRQAYGVPASEVVEALRMDEARTLLCSSRGSVQSVARAVGFASADSFRRAFVRRFGVAPSGYRAPFSAAAL